MTKKNKIIVTIVGVTLVLLTLLGITYAYYLTRIEGNTNTNSVSITTADLKLLYGDGNGEVTANDIMPGTEIIKTFSVTNKGNSKVTGYVIVIENLVNTLGRKQDLVYTLECKLNDNTSCGNTVEQTYPSGFSTAAIFANDIEVGVTQNYTLKVEYINEPNIDQSDDMGSSIKGKINIVDARTLNPYDTGITSTNNTSLVYNIINNAKTKLNGTELTGTPKTIPAKEISAADEKVLSVTSDYLGASYYFRGSIEDNYVLFNNMCFRIVRIEGDGSVKLIFAGDVTAGATNCNEVGTNTGLLKDSDGNIISMMYGYNANNYADYANNSKGILYGKLGLEDAIESWYTLKFNTEELRGNLKIDKWCLGGNIDYKYDDYGNLFTDETLEEFYDENGFYIWSYSARNRVDITKTTSLLCENEDFVESKYGAITVDEVLLAGDAVDVGLLNTSYYLNDNIQDGDYWTLSYFGLLTDYDYAYSVSSIGGPSANAVAYDGINVRPSITLVPGTTIVEGGTGTKSNPYKVS